MRVAVLSDIHGNLMALDAVMTDIERQSVDEVWCGGDLGFGGPWAGECIKRVRETGWPTVRGNADVWITGDFEGISDPARREKIRQICEAHSIDEEHSKWLRDLPLTHAGLGSVVLMHGTPHSPFEAPAPDASAAEFEPYEGAAALVVYGHIHIAFVRKLKEATVVCNPGSVGMPKDGETASYALLDLNGPEWAVRFRRVPFDRRAALAEAKRMGSPIGDFFVSTLEGA